MRKSKVPVALYLPTFASSAVMLIHDCTTDQVTGACKQDVLYPLVHDACQLCWVVVSPGVKGILTHTGPQVEPAIARDTGTASLLTCCAGSSFAWVTIAPNLLGTSAWCIHQACSMQHS
jgi:hypothetical protein